MSSDYNMEDSQDGNAGHDQTDGAGGPGGEENNEADMIFAPEASKPGRNAGMLMVAFVMIGVGVIYFMRARGGPGKVVANPDVLKADELIKGFANDHDQITKMRKMLNETAKVVGEFEKERSASQVPVTSLKNPGPFEFVPPGGKPTAVVRPETDKAKGDFLRDVEALHVTYIMVSATMKSAMINNKLIREGQEIEGLTIEKITPTSVMVTRGKYRAEAKQVK